MSLQCFFAASILHLIADEFSTFATYKRSFLEIVTTFDESHILSTIAVAMVLIIRPLCILADSYQPAYVCNSTLHSFKFLLILQKVDHI